MKRIFFIIVCLGIIFPLQKLNAQNQLKIGHVNVQEILTLLPESDSAQVILEKDTKDFELMYENMQVELNKLVDDFENNQASFSDLIRKTKESEILRVRDNLVSFQQNANQQLSQKNAELLQPILDKIQNAIDEVATNGNFTYILDVSKGSVVFVSQDSQNLNELILKTLGVKE